MSDGIDDEHRVAAFRDRYGRVAYEARERDLIETNPARTPGHPWQEIARGGRDHWGKIAEAVIDAFMSGVVLNDQDLADETAQERRWRVE